MIALRRWIRSIGPDRLDWLIAAILLVVLETAIWTGARAGNQAVTATTVLALCAAVAFRRRWLLEVLTVAIVVLAVRLVAWGPTTTGGGGGGLIGVMLVFYAAGAFYTGRRSWLALGLGIAVVSLASVQQGGQLLSNVMLGLGVAVLPPYLIGRMARDASERARASRARSEHLDAERESLVRAAALAERTRLAREIHDVIAHSVSVMVIQSAGARTVMDRDHRLAEQSLRAVERAGREALAELRHLLGLLGDRRTLRELAPQPGLDDLGELVARTSAAGVTASMRVDGRPAMVSAGLSLCAYRVVQEALTNAIKHAGPARAEVSVRWLDDLLELSVVDDGGAARNGSPRLVGGHGILGMRERVALHGGTVSAGPSADGGFAVRASIPLAQEAVA
jgi:signal transduction histidine kinase